MCFHFKSGDSKRIIQIRLYVKVFFLSPTVTVDSVMLSLTLPRKLVGCFSPLLLSSSLVLALIFNTSPGMGCLLSRHLH